MEIKFQTKEESNHQQQEDFLKLSGTERFRSFIQLSERITKLFPPKLKIENKLNSFLIIIESK